MLFTLNIELGNEAMADSYDVAKALRKIADNIEHWETSARESIKDANGNTVGTWEFIDTPEPLSNDEIITAVQNYCADLHAAHEAGGGLDHADGSVAWTPENAAHVAALLNQASGEFDPWSLFRFMDEQTGSWRVGYKTSDGRDWFHVLRQMRNASSTEAGAGLLDLLGR